jgi:hypothetical protein
MSDSTQRARSFVGVSFPQARAAFLGGSVVHGKRRVTAHTALPLARYFGTSPEFWMNLQAHYDLRVERRNLSAIDAIRPLHSA